MAAHDTSLRDADDVALADYADGLAQALAQDAAEHDRNGTFAHNHFEQLRQAGALALTIPKAYGGQGRSLYQLLLFQERLARGSGPTALTLGWHLMAFAYLSHALTWAPERFAQLCKDVVERGDLINILITERDAGNLLRGARPTTSATRTATGYTLSGRKGFCSGAPELGQMVVFAWIEEEQRSAEFLVPRGPGVQVQNNWHTMGMRATGSHDIVFDAVHVPHDALVHYIGADQSSSFTSNSRAFGLQLAAVYLGIASAARDFTLKFARQHHANNPARALAELPLVQHKLGEIELSLGTARALLYGLAERWERNPGLRSQLGLEVGIVKTTVTRLAVEVLDRAMQLVGGHSLSQDLPLERYFRDVRCGLFNPPQDDMVISKLAQAALA
jgi:alkylation response protein AidB-like acyl-CoA dehydrogenase